MDPSPSPLSEEQLEELARESKREEEASRLEDGHQALVHHLKIDLGMTDLTDLVVADSKVETGWAEDGEYESGTTYVYEWKWNDRRYTTRVFVSKINRLITVVESKPVYERVKLNVDPIMVEITDPSAPNGKRLEVAEGPTQEEKILKMGRHILGQE